MLIYSQFMSDEKKQTNTLNNGFFHQNDVTPRCGDNRDFCLRTLLHCTLPHMFFCSTFLPSLSLTMAVPIEFDYP